MLITGLVLAGAAALLHVFIFYLESIAWTSARARAVFGITAEEAHATRELAFNQGFYNLFLAVAALLGALLTALGHQAVGLTLVFTGVGSMLAAALVLALSSPDKRAAAFKQGALPLFSVAALALSFAF
ncbi:DUF1304 domain-containing protein [Leucobacter chromiireducens]|uniref:DUF1304 domain-containing protein n=1 Tax=Leucobacter chromiireducens subsp. chromiireducens TaxID=660067 RepID=A0ABS1SLS8_9MICO|nr:DUF1304 domain-containing protein [Leucobacter chromiireducens]MBL3688550.1 DUF1304 domain-containing protein [Leucobacter chromiireducens subsp. chromiireducens]